MATAAQKQHSNAACHPHIGSGNVTTGSSLVPEDPRLTPSQRRKRPLSIIKESDTDSDASGETLAGKDVKGKNSSNGTDGSNRKPTPRLCQSAAATSGRGAAPNRAVNTSFRCSPHIRKLTDKFERSAASSPSRVNSKPPVKATTPNTANKNGKALDNSSSGGSNVVRTSSPRTVQPRTSPAKTGPTMIMKSARAADSSSPSPTPRTVTSSTGRTSSSAQNSRPAVKTGPKAAQNSTDTSNKQNLSRGKSATARETKKPPISVSSSDSKTNSVKSKSVREETLEISESTENSQSRQNEDNSSQNGHTATETIKERLGEPQDGNSTLMQEHSEQYSSRIASEHEPSNQENASPSHRLSSLAMESNVSPAPRVGGGLARIRETAERLKLTSPSSPLLPSPSHSPLLSSSTVPMFSQRIRIQSHPTSPPSLLITPGGEGSSSPEGNPAIPLITVTPSDNDRETSRPPPPPLGPSVSSVSCPSSQHHSSPVSHSSTVVDKTNQTCAFSGSNNDAIDSSNNNIKKDVHNNSSILNSLQTNQNISVSNQDVSNMNNKGALLHHQNQHRLHHHLHHHHHITTNLNYHNNLNIDHHNSRNTFPRTSHLHHTSRPTSTPSLSQTLPLPPSYYKLSNSAFFARRLSSGGSSICEEDEEENGEEKENKEDKQNRNNERGKEDSDGGGTTVIKQGALGSFPSLLLSERGSSVSSFGSSNSSSSSITTDPISPLLPQPSSLHQFTASDLGRLKETAEKLRLTTRRASTMAWRQKYMDSPGQLRAVPLSTSAGSNAVDDGKLTQDRKQRIDAALEWLREELQEMRSQDQSLARQLLTIRQDIHQLKLQRSTEEHQDLIDDFRNELEELQELSDVLDLPQPVYGGDNPLRNIGVTRLNLSARRFSAC